VRDMSTSSGLEVLSGGHGLALFLPGAAQGFVTSLVQRLVQNALNPARGSILPEGNQRFAGLLAPAVGAKTIPNCP
jgi:hypothetical protein